MLILPSPGTLPVIESAGHSGDVGIKPAPAAAITSDSDESSITKCGWSTKRGVPPPVLQIPGLEHPPDQLQEPAVVDLFAEYREQDRVLKAPEAVGDVSLDEPVRSLPSSDHLLQRGVTPPAGTKPVGVLGELGVVIRIQQHAHHLGHQLVRPRRHA